MRVIFIIPPFGLMKDNGKIKQKMGFLPYLGLASIATILKNEGHSIKILDLQVKNMPLDAIIMEIKKFNADIVGFSVTSPLITVVEEIAQRIKKELNLPIICGGPHISIFPAKVLQDNISFDYSVIGEGEFIVKDLINSIETGKTLDKIEGIAYRSNSRIKTNHGYGMVADLDKLPIPSREFFELEKYTPCPQQYFRFPTTNMITSRGCAYGRCTFCFGMSKCQFRRRSTDITIEEIKYLQDKYKIKDIVFWDNEFVVGDKWVNEFCNKLHREKIDITWSCYARANFVNKNILKIMADAGCWNVYYGLESGNQDLLDNISKGITLQQTRDAIKWTSEAGMESRGAFILGLPGETPLKGKQTIDFAISLGLDYAQFSFATPYPGTKFYDTSSKYGKILSTDYSKMTLEHPVFLPNGYKDISQLIELRKVAYRRFYMNPSYFLLRLKKLRRTEDFRRYVKGIQYLIADKLFKSN